MNHIIFGGEGFTGRVICEYLKNKNQKVLSVDLVRRSQDRHYFFADITDKASLEEIPLQSDDIVYHLAARQYHVKPPRKNRDDYFRWVNFGGTKNILEWMKERGARRLVYFSTDMVYGIPQSLPIPPDHPTKPVGPYGRSKLEAERLCQLYRENEKFQITILRPRLIIGPGRLGILTKLFWLMSHNLPVPLIGSGKNAYQMVSVFDCASAAMLAWEKGIPNADLNLGSAHPPRVRDLMAGLIKRIQSRSLLVPLPANLLKTGLATLGMLGFELMFREQYSIANLQYEVDIRPTERVLGWVPQYSDEEMIWQAYTYYLQNVHGVASRNDLAA